MKARCWSLSSGRSDGNSELPQVVGSSVLCSGPFVTPVRVLQQRALLRMRIHQCCHRVSRFSLALLCVESLMMQTDDRRRKKHSLNSRSVSEEYCLRVSTETFRRLTDRLRMTPSFLLSPQDRPKEDATKMKNKVSTSQVSGRKKPWSWDQYLEEERAVAAPLQLFNEFQTFPSSRNGFKVGMRLEGIDPLHPSMFCVLTVAEVIGFRLRLHVDGYSECYDLWVNSDSPGIKPAGWCESTGHKLHPPKGYKPNEFSWENYLESLNAQAAPKNLFKTQNSESPHTSRAVIVYEEECVE
ncbi:Lethal(3)malignant brain tumor-like protein 3 [Triplophysa tibetana]|uniref:Lethal(3)malignant brain tumor-like protein 3 n=1 Tax=Triplophysa tibetana TaxID=1572043 RepID=A0A5A9N9Y3_9TELE|nr:Lethal(3)malignant brain tumor-like protein 3 [Triplophysa tibetana]